MAARYPTDVEDALESGAARAIVVAGMVVDAAIAEVRRALGTVENGEH